MASIRSIEGLAGACARRPWRVVVLWLVVLLAMGGLAGAGLGDVLTNDVELTNDAESVAGLARVEDSALSEEAALSETVLVRSLTGATVDDPAFRERTQAVADALRAQLASWGHEPNPGEPQVVTWYELAALGAPQAQGLVSADRTATIIPVSFPGMAPAEVPIERFVESVERFDDDAFDVTTVGVLSINEEFSHVAEQDLVRGEVIGIPIAVMVLVTVFGALLAPALPLLLGIFSIGITLGIVTLIGQVETLQLFIQNMVTMLGLAIGIDYSLFIVERYREQRRLGSSRQRAIELAGATAGKAVLFSGGTVAVALLGVMLIPSNIFFSLGLGAVIVVAVAVTLTLTLLPAMLSLLGDRINWPRHTQSREVHEAESRDAGVFSGFWGTLTRLVMARPVVSAVVATILLLALAAPVLDLHTGFTGAAQMPSGEIREASLALEANFSAGVLSPVEIVIAGEHTEAVDAAVRQLVERLNASGDFAPVEEPARWDEERDLGLLTATMLYPGDSDEAYDVVRELRDEHIPATIGQLDGYETYVTGTSAINLDFLDMLGSYTPIVVSFVLGLSFVLLLVAFRSIVVPLKAIVFNLLSVGATWGLMVLVFQKGFLIDLLGFQRSPVIESWIPILLFCILFGLSMDYHVFLLSRIREHYDLTGNNRESVALGLRTTSRIITGAALIMVVVFGAFSTGRLVALQQMGFGLAFAVFLDATIVRSVLVPSAMALLSDANWYLPRWLRWLPDVRIEGEAPPEPTRPAPAD